MAERVAVGVDIGGTSIKFGLVRDDGTILHQTSNPTHAEEGPDGVLMRVAVGVRSLPGMDQSGVAGIGVGVPGMMNRHGEICHPPNFPGWEVEPVAKKLRRMLETDLPIAVENDANVAGYAEAYAGTGSSDRDFLFVTLGTGVGGCIIQDGRIWHGGGGGAGEIGHITVDMHGQLCNCGSRGCLEAYIGQRYMSDLARTRLQRIPDSMLHAMIAAGEELSPKTIDEAAQSGDEFAVGFLAEMGEILGAGLASALNMCDIRLVIIGGGMSRADRFLLEPARKSLQARVLKSIAPYVELRPARFFNDAGMIGAALLAMR